MTTATLSRQLKSGDKFRAIATLILFIGIAIGSQAQTFTTLWTFSNQDGNQPQGTLILGSDGNFYGTTYQGGQSKRLPALRLRYCLQTHSAKRIDDNLCLYGND